MATPQNQTKETWPLKDDHDYSQDFDQETYSSSGCGCFHGFCWWRRRSRNEGNGYMLHQQEDQNQMINKESWLKKKAKKLKEMSEILAGPKWKNFIRSFSKRSKSSSMQFQYDPRSYELNFDDGIHREVDDGFPDFSARFAAPAGAGIIHK
ncbi:hypothetical protein CCACVL1_23375 [Corchorus capsularis]|uniref:Stress induced protein n=1 Tax=Corchorus capsularis TaxID=210143 RepID=A0A1R3GU02_COCAP|nr:hypothetical protein CCACVL1_23375 [Corchorus capsularis]